MQAIKRWIKKNFAKWVYREQIGPVKKHELIDHAEEFSSELPARLSDASYDVFTYHGEDGIIFSLLQHLNNVPHVFVDIGAGDCIKSNCANLAFHFGWQGLFVDQDKKQLSLGKDFYKKMFKKSTRLKFAAEQVSAENINKIISSRGFRNEVGLLSIDIDGNDYWIWKALDVIQPRILVIEAKVEFGHRDIIVPYGEHNHHSVDPKYNGASVEAFVQLGKKKGYKLVGANRQGYNLFFVKNNEPVPAVSSAEILTDPETMGSFYPASFFNERKFVTEPG